jgi:membrane-associated phospholipid phosphatase
MRWGVRQPQAGGGTAGPRPLLPPSLRRAASGLVVACIAVVVALGIAYHGQSHGGWLDAVLDPRIQHAFGRFSRTLDFLADTGSILPVTLMVAALALACVATRRWTGAVLVVVAEPVAIVLTEYVLKPAIGRTMGASSLSFPSGHATAMFALAVTVAILLADPPRQRWPAAVRALVVLAALVFAAAVALAMVTIGAHYITDAIGGAAVGTGTALACALTLDLLGARLRPAAAPPPDQPPPDQPQPDQPQPGHRQQAGQQQAGPPRPAPAAPRRSAG